MFLFSLQPTLVLLLEVQVYTIQTIIPAKLMVRNIPIQINIQVTQMPEDQLFLMLNLLRHLPRHTISRTPTNSTLINCLHIMLSMDESFMIFFVELFVPTKEKSTFWNQIAN